MSETIDYQLLAQANLDAADNAADALVKDFPPHLAELVPARHAVSPYGVVVTGAERLNKARSLVPQAERIAASEKAEAERLQKRDARSAEQTEINEARAKLHYALGTNAWAGTLPPNWKELVGWVDRGVPIEQIRAAATQAREEKRLADEAANAQLPRVGFL